MSVMKRIIFAAAAAVLSGLVFTGCKEKNTLPDFVKNDMELVWSDEFDGDNEAPNSENWDFNTGANGWGNGEVQNYTKDRSNSYVSKGTLKIVAYKNDKNKWTSARLLSSFKKNFQYGYIEFRAKLPKEPGSWPALWLLPQFNKYGNWPRSGEIDVMEYATNTWGTKTYGTVHCLAGYGGNAVNSEYVNIKNVDKKWHTYAINWTEDSITWYYDGVPFTEYKNPHSENDNWMGWPYDKPFFIIMNVAMGGTLGGDIPKNLQRCQMEVDYVRVYQNKN